MLSVRTKRKENNIKNRSELLKNKFCAKAQGIEYPPILSPEGIVYTIDNLSEFCRVYNLQTSNLRKVLNGARISHKGWVLA
jgi:hypothetical protein